MSALHPQSWLGRVLRGHGWRSVWVWALLGLSAAPAHAALPIEHWVTARGAQVYFVASAALPILDIQIDFDAGERRDPAGQAGLAAMTAAMLARGAAGLNETTIAERFADWGVQHSATASDDRASVTLRVLADPAQREPAVALWARVLAQPDFPASAWVRERERLEQSLRESLTRPDGVAQRAFLPLLYPQHPYGQVMTVQTLNAIKRADLRQFYRRHYAAKRATVSLIGAISRVQAQAIAEQLTRDLPAGGEMPALPPVQAPEPVERWIDHPSSQSHLLVGVPAVARNDAAFFPLMVGNHVLGGGGFVSLLMRELREQRGLTYGVSSGLSPLMQAGPFVMSMQTQRAQAGEALAVLKRVLADFVREGPTVADVRAAQDNLIGSFALRWDSQREQLGLLALIGWYGLPLDYLERWPNEVAAVTPEQVRAAFARVIDPQRLVTVIVGARAPGLQHDAAP